jgi:hypothetical protein
MGEMAARVMAKALEPDLESWGDLPHPECIKAMARLAFRFAMKACPVPTQVFGVLTQQGVPQYFRLVLMRRWNIKPGIHPAVVGRLSCREPNLRVDTK